MFSTEKLLHYIDEHFLCYLNELNWFNNSANHWQHFLRRCMVVTQLVQLSENVWVIQGGANIGVIAYDGRCLIIDSGMDKDVGRGILNQVNKLNLTPGALLVTHAHADHFGGAHYL